MSGPLGGVLVVALEQAVAAPLATRHLADLGARVIKVERPGVGDFARRYDDSVRGMSSYFVWLNRGKESVELDLKDPDDLNLLHTLLARADVFIQNLAPGVTDRLGLGEAALRVANSRLITSSISGYGRGGVVDGRKAYDLLMQCETGLVSITGSPDAQAKVGISIADIAASMYCYSGVLTALYQRERTGSGAHVPVAMLDALGEWMSQPYLYDRYGANGPPKRRGIAHATIAPYGPYRVAEGTTVLIAIQNEREWARLCEDILEQPGLVCDNRFLDNVSRVRNTDALDGIIQSVVGELTEAALIQRLDHAGIANTHINTVADFGNHPQLAARARWRDVDTPTGSVRMLAPVVPWPDADEAPAAVPALGEHTARVRAEFAALGVAPGQGE